ncbi:MAG TPA: alpha/beta hydrolase [Azospirillaceae bacterium]|nr:alpha/beta hydrolase [Azospirillaceae bacterium]
MTASLRHEWADGAGVRLHCAVMGEGEPVLLLHGFPDFWYGWRRLMPLLAPHCLAVAPDLRGYNLSDKPAGPDAYAMDALVADIAALARRYGRGRPVAVVGNDWGGVAAWVAAERHPQLFRRLAILNAPHPAVLARALREDPAQRQAVDYMRRLRQPGIETILAANDFAPLLGAMAELSDGGHLDPADIAAYREAWARPGALAAMLGWYRAASFTPPEPHWPWPGAPIEVSALLLWGARDGALLPGLAEAHRPICTDLRLHLLDGVSHWPQVEAPERAADLLLPFLLTDR